MKLSDYIEKYGDNDVDETVLFELTADNDINVLQEIAVLKKKLSELNDELELSHKITNALVIFQVLYAIINIVFKV